MNLNSNEVFNKLPDKGINIVEYSIGGSPQFFNIKLAEKWLKENKNVTWISCSHTEEQFKVLAGKFALRTASDKFKFREISMLLPEDKVNSPYFEKQCFINSIIDYCGNQKENQLIVIDDIGFFCDLFNSDYRDILKALCKIGSYFNENFECLISITVSERFCKKYRPNFYNLSSYAKIEEYNSGLDSQVTGKIDIFINVEETGLIYYDFSYLVKDRSITFIPTGVGAV
uniref:ATPase n=1 Tax=Parastrongyloides trichosuri TaxID=131310 RepID=A0A0N4ZYM5_PARTI